MAPLYTLLASANLALLLSARHATAERELHSDSFQTCVDNSALNAESFSATIKPDSNTLEYDIVGNNTYSGQVAINFRIVSTGETVYNATLDPCSGDLAALCPASPGQIALTANQQTPEGGFDRIPNATFTEANPQAYFQLRMISVDSSQTVGCLQANLTNDASNSTAGSDTTSASNSTASGDMNDDSGGSTNASGGGSDGGSGASTAYLNWTLLGSAVAILLCGSSL